jgi:hypothetical protein
MNRGIDTAVARTRPSLPGRPAAARQGRTRRALAAGLATAFVMLLPAAVTGAWLRGTVLSTRGYVAAVTPVAANPVVRATVREAVTSQSDAALNSAAKALPSVPAALAGPLRPRRRHRPGRPPPPDRAAATSAAARRGLARGA